MNQKVTITITGGPGSGKTIIMNMVYYLLSKIGYKNVTIEDGDRDDKAMELSFKKTMFTFEMTGKKKHLFFGGRDIHIRTENK